MNGTIRVFDEVGIMIKSRVSHLSTILALKCSPNGQYLASGGIEK